MILKKKKKDRQQQQRLFCFYIASIFVSPMFACVYVCTVELGKNCPETQISITADIWMKHGTVWVCIMYDTHTPVPTLLCKTAHHDGA